MFRRRRTSRAEFPPGLPGLRVRHESAPAPPDAARSHRALQLESLEPRILLSAALDVVFIDSEVDDIELLRRAAGDDAVVIVADANLNGADDAIEQIVTELKRLELRARTLTILSHGDEGAIQLAGETVGASSIDGGAWSQLSGHLSDDANVYLYGCNVAHGQGQALLNAISEATGADVFGSDDLTGEGGDWILEIASAGADGAPGPEGPLSHQILAGYAATLAGPTAAYDEAATDEDTSLTVSAADGVLSNDTNDPALDLTVPGFSIDHDAGQDDDGDSFWESIVGGYNFSLHASVTRELNPMTNYFGITASYSFTGAGGGTNFSLEAFPGNPTNDPVTFELWFRPSDLVGQHVLWETGATGDGVSISILNDELHFKVKDSGTNAQLSGAGVTDQEFNHVVGVIDKGGLGGANANTDVYLYLDGQLIDVRFDVANLNDWAGGNAAGIGVVNSGINFPSGGAFIGEIARFRMYEFALTAEEALQNFETLTVPNYGLTIVDFDSAGAVGHLTLGETGAYIYDSAGALDHLNVGETAIETFTYRVEDSLGAISTGTLQISVIGVNDGPVATGIDDVSLLEDDPSITLELLGAFADVDDEALTFELVDIVGDPAFESIDLDAASGALLLAPAPEQSGSVTITVRATDSSGASAQQSFDATIGAVNDAPSVRAPSAIDTEVEVVFSAESGTMISVDDIDSANTLVRLDLVAENGFITVDDAGGVIFTKGDGVLDDEIRIIGTLDEINFAINNLRFKPEQESASLLVTLNDLGATGAGGEKTASALVNINFEEMEQEVRAPLIETTRERVVFVNVERSEIQTPIREPSAPEIFAVRTPAAFIAPLTPDFSQPAGFGFPARSDAAQIEIEAEEGGVPAESEAAGEFELAGAAAGAAQRDEQESGDDGEDQASPSEPVLSDATEDELHSSAIDAPVFMRPNPLETGLEELTARDAAAIALLPLLAMQRVRHEQQDNRRRPAA